MPLPLSSCTTYLHAFLFPPPRTRLSCSHMPLLLLRHCHTIPPRCLPTACCTHSFAGSCTHTPRAFALFLTIHTALHAAFACSSSHCYITFSCSAPPACALLAYLTSFTHLLLPHTSPHCTTFCLLPAMPASHFHALYTAALACTAHTFCLLLPLSRAFLACLSSFLLALHAFSLCTCLCNLFLFTLPATSLLCTSSMLAFLALSALYMHLFLACLFMLHTHAFLSSLLLPACTFSTVGTDSWVFSF